MADRPILFVGDIQGCGDELEELLEVSGFQPDSHRLIPVGDTINRGPNAPKVIRQLYQAGAEPVLGNHELALIRHVEAGDLPDWENKGAALTQLMETAMLEEALEWIYTWPLFRSGSDWLAVHAGLHPLLEPESTPAAILTNMRYCTPEGERPPMNDNKLFDPPEGFAPWYQYYKGQKTVVFGHWAIHGLINHSRLRGLDTGCVYGGQLTGLWWPEDRLVKVASRQPYRRFPSAKS